MWGLFFFSVCPGPSTPHCFNEKISSDDVKWQNDRRRFWSMMAENYELLVPKATHFCSTPSLNRKFIGSSKESLRSKSVMETWLLCCWFCTGWLQKWRQWRRTVVTTSCVTSGPSASPPLSSPSCSRPCLTCTPCGMFNFLTSQSSLRGFCSYSMRLCSSTVPHLIWLLEPSLIYIIKPPSRCHHEPINLCFCSAQGFVFDVKEQLPASEAERQKQMVSVLFSHYLVILCTLSFRE